MSAPAAEQITARAADVGWYHCLELAPGLVTDGMFDLRYRIYNLKFLIKQAKQDEIDRNGLAPAIATMRSTPPLSTS